MGANVTAYTDPTSNPTTPYRYRIRALNTIGSSVPGYPTITAESDWTPYVDYLAVPTIPAVPTNVSVTAVRANGNNDTVTLTWTDNSNNETGFTIQRSTNPAFTNPATYNVGANLTQFSQSTARSITYYYRVRANASAQVVSGWVNATPFPIVTP